MTTIDTATAWHGKPPITLALIATGLALALAGCGSSGSLLGSSDATNPAVTDTGATALAVAPAGRLAVAPVIGPPEPVAKPLQSQLAAALEKQKVGITKTPAEKADYTLRGYIVSAKDKASTKVSYIWDVTDAAGKKVNRITGEELVAGAPGKDPWSAITPDVMQKVADKTAVSVATWMSAQAGPAAPVQAVNAPPNAGLGAAPAASGASGPVTAVVSDIKGAPGDGGTALKVALRRELSRGGVSLTETQNPGVYRVDANVEVGEAKDGKQPIRIIWKVTDANGRKVGEVSQKEEIPQGSLDGAWGKTADLAAAAAAQGILTKVLPQAKSVNGT